MNDTILKNEYQKQKQKIQYCRLGKDTIIIPVSYQGNADKLADDLFGYEQEAQKYRKYNQTCAQAEELDAAMLQAGDVSFLPPFDLVKSGKSKSEIIKKATQRALRQYRAALKKTERHNKEYPDNPRLTQMDKDSLEELDKKHQRYCAAKLINKFGQAAKFTAQQIAQMSAGAAGILPVVAYHFLDKKFHFANSKTKNTIDKKVVPYICKGALKALIPLTMYGAVKITSDNNQKNTKEEINAIQFSPIETEEEIIAKIESNKNKNKKILRKKHNIDSPESFQKLYNDALSFMTLSMFPTEVLVNTPYSDNKKKKNTIGLGSFWYPKNGNPQSSDWMLVSKYIKLNPEITVTGQQAYALTDGWFRFRDDGRIYQTMYNELKGCELSVHEFAAIATVTYNNEVNGKKLCQFVRKYYKSPIKCAAMIMELKPRKKDNEEGIRKRHAHEALIYLNIDNYIDKMQHLVIKKDTNSLGEEFYVTSVTQLKYNDCIAVQKGLKKGGVYSARKLAQKITSYHTINESPVYKIAHQNGIGYLCDYSGKEARQNELLRKILAQKTHKQAISYYKNKEYDKAILYLEKIQENGFNSAGIHNDKANIYYDMKEYENCIKECQKILKTGEKEFYAAANYNAGKAYEKLGNREKALRNYELAAKRNSKEKVYKNAVQRLSKKQTSLVLKTKRDKSHG